MDSLSEPFKPLFNIVIFLSAHADTRVKRLRDRELQEFGDRIKVNGDMHVEHEHFIKWAHQYEDGQMGGRSLIRHENWLKTLNCPVIRMNNNNSFSALVSEARLEISSILSSK